MKILRNRLGLIASLASIAAMASTPSLAQSGSETAESASYPAEYFVPFNPVTAEDMVRRVPGFTLDDGSDRRGFAGSAGNVLINGERPSSKAPISEQLSRISARDVARIDVQAGAAIQGDLRGHSLVVDVRLRHRQTGATNTFVAQLGALEPGWRANPVLVISSASRLGPVDASLSLQAQPARRGRIEYDKQLVTAGGAFIEGGPEYLQGRYYEYKLSGKVGWRPTADDVVGATFQVIPKRDGRHTLSEVFGPSGARIRTEDSKVRGDAALDLEFGSDWERRLTARTSLKLLGLAARRQNGSDERYTTGPVSGPPRSTFIRREAESGEYIGRGVYTVRASREHTLEFGGEGAFNYLDSALDIWVDAGAGRVRTPIPVANTRVEETRGEIYVSELWRPTDTFSLDATLTVEASRIVQSGDAAQERTFTFVKPRLVATWNPTPRDQLRLRLERDVAQLDFTEFASAVSLFDGTIQLGNPDLEPERAWRAQLDWERRFGPKAVLTLTVFHDAVEAVQDQVPIAGQFDAPGNLGNGRRTGARLDALAPLGAVGLPRGELRLRGMIQETRVDDPLTGQSRRFSDEAEWNYSIDVRQPVPGMKIAWGVVWERSDDVQLFRLRELRTTGWDRGSLDIYVETTAVDGLLIRFTVADVLLPREVRERRFFDPDRSSPANLSRIETRRAIGGYGTRSYTLRVAGRF